MLTIEEFCNSCEKKFCNRHTFYNKTCARRLKQESCYTKWVKQNNKNFKKFKDKLEEDYKFIEEVWIYYTGSYTKSFFEGESWKKYCALWLCLSDEEKQIASTFDGMFLNQNIDVAHIESRNQSRKHIKDKDNVILMGRYFHTCLDTLIDPVTGVEISVGKKTEWMLRAKENIDKLRGMC